MSVSLTARLTFWYTAVLSLVLIGAAAAFYAVHGRLRLADVDEELARTEALVARVMPTELDEGLPLAEASTEALADFLAAGRLLAAFDAAGRHLAGPWDGLPGPGPAARGDASVTASVQTAAGPFRIHWRRHLHGGTTYQLAAAQSLLALEQELGALRRALLIGGAVALGLAAAGGWWIARQALRPVTAMAGQASAITDRTPGRRLAVPEARDELGQLARAFNDLLGRLESALSAQRRFMADASHELRTPVSIARSAAEVTLSQPGRPEAEYRENLGVIAAQTRRLARIVGDMFLLARADAAGLPLERAALYLDEVVAACVREARLLDPAKAVDITWDGPSDLEATGDERLLRQMLMNLLDNAVRHSPSGAGIHVGLVSHPEAFEIAVTDRGGGIAEPDRERIFDRFVRLSGAVRAADGAGLGLPIARTIAEAHGGSLVLARSDASGSTFVVRLPRFIVRSPPA